MNRDAIVQHLQQSIPGLLAIYAFGSRIQGTATAASDLDLAVLLESYADPLLLWQQMGDLEDLAGCAVDLLDLRAASTVMQYQVITSGQCWWAQDVRTRLFEAGVLSDKTELDAARSTLLKDIQREGRIYGR